MTRRRIWNSSPKNRTTGFASCKTAIKTFGALVKQQKPLLLSCNKWCQKPKSLLYRSLCTQGIGLFAADTFCNNFFLATYEINRKNEYIINLLHIFINTGMLLSLIIARSRNYHTNGEKKEQQWAFRFYDKHRTHAYKFHILVIYYVSFIVASLRR